MANVSFIEGFRPVGRIGRVLPGVAGGTVYAGDPVSLDNTGRWIVTTAGSTVGGVVLNYAIVAGAILVSCDPEQIYESQGDEADISALTIVGNTFDHIVGTPSSVYKASRTQIDSSTVATSSGQWVMVGPSQLVGNAYGTNTKALFRINEHQMFGKDAFAGI